MNYLIDEVLDGPRKYEVDLVHVPAEPIRHLSHLVRPYEVDRRVDYPAYQVASSPIALHLTCLPPILEFPNTFSSKQSLRKLSAGHKSVDIAIEFPAQRRAVD